MVGIYNLFDEEYIRWQRIRFAEEGNAVFRGGVGGNGIRRCTEPGRNYRLTLSMTFNLQVFLLSLGPSRASFFASKEGSRNQTGHRL